MQTGHGAAREKAIKIRQIFTMLVAMVSSTSLMLGQPVRARASLEERTFDLTYAAEVHTSRVQRRWKSGCHIRKVMIVRES
jgi:hypothetical protein